MIHRTFRPSTIRRGAAVAVGVAALVLAGCTQPFSSTATVSLTSFGPAAATEGPRTVGIGDPVPAAETMVVAAAPDAIEVRSRNGSIIVRVDDSIDVMHVKANIRCKAMSQTTADERAEAASVSMATNDEGTVVITPEMPGGWKNGDAASFEVRLPSSASVVAVSSNGSITIEGAEGDVDATTSNGSVKLVGTSGDARAVTSNGRVTVESHLGPLHARSSNGRMVIRMHDDAVDPVTVRTSNGSVRFEVGSEFGGWIDATTSNGSVDLSGFKSGVEEVESSRRRLRVKLAGADHTSNVRTSNGSVVIERSVSE